MPSLALESYTVEAQGQPVTAPTPATQLLPTNLTGVERRRGQRAMVKEGAIWSVMNTITAGTVVTSFALDLHADAFVIGLLSTLPLLAALLQLWTPQIVAKIGSRKKAVVWSATGARVLWLPVALLGLGYWLKPELEGLWLSLFLALVTLSAAFTAVTGSAWLSWAGTMVPIEKRAGYFARRNTIIGVIGLASSLLIGLFLDWWSKPGPKGHQPVPGAYILLFMIAFSAGAWTIFVLRGTPDLPAMPNAPRPRFLTSLTETWKHVPLRKYLIFRSAWLFSLTMVGPYYTVYMLQNLQISLTQVFLLQNIAALAGLLSTPFWGRMLDRYGCSRILFWINLTKAVWVGAWFFLSPGPMAFVFLLVLNICLVVDSGMNLASGNLLMNLLPENTGSSLSYVSVFTAVTSLASALGPTVAGILITLIGTGQFGLFGGFFGAFQIIFLLSALLRLASMVFYKGFADSPARPV